MCVYFGLFECPHPVEEDKVQGVWKYYDKEETRVSEKGSIRAWRKRDSETLINLFSSQNIIGIVNQNNETYGSRRKYEREQKYVFGLVKKPEEKRKLRRNNLKQGDITTVDIT